MDTFFTAPNPDFPGDGEEVRMDAQPRRSRRHRPPEAPREGLNGSSGLLQGNDLDHMSDRPDRRSEILRFSCADLEELLTEFPKGYRSERNSNQS